MGLSVVCDCGIPDHTHFFRGLNFALSLHLCPYFVYASSKGSGETGHIIRLVHIFAAETSQSRSTLFSTLILNTCRCY